jgi:AcrR family transcriptional regulator
LDPLSTAVASRHERRRQETADRIVEAAAYLFGERGVAATTVADICERADIARQTFFNHFETKQDLVGALARRGNDFFREAVATARSEGLDTATRIARLFEIVHTATASVGPMHQDMLAEVTRVFHDTSDRETLDSVLRGVEKLLRTGRAEGDVSRAYPLEDQAAMVLGSLQYLVFQWTHQRDFPIAERAARMARLLADALAP